MAEDNSYYEILEYAIQREVEAYYFYTEFAKRVESLEMRQALKDFAEDELEHKTKLELEIMKTGRTLSTDEKLPRVSHDNYNKSNAALLGDMDYKDLLLLAIKKEEASFKTYINLLPTVHDQQCREVLLAIAEEEVKHKECFEIEYDMLLKQH